MISITLAPGDYDSFAVTILSRNHGEIDIAELTSVSIKVNSFQMATLSQNDREIDITIPRG